MCKMCKLLEILLCLVVAVTLEYDLKCPDSGEWRLRAVGFNCSIKSQYVCLFKYPERTYHETCDGLDYSSIGSKLIYEPFFNKAYCSYERYQPFPFSTDGNSKCVYEKSFCTEKGQYLFQRGSQRSDITCGCDLTKGYEFVTKPKHDCYCVPSAEDCSCYKIPCNNLVDQCPQDRDEILTKFMFTTFQENRFTDAINLFDDKNNGKTYRFQCLYISSALLAGMIIVMILFLTMVTVFEHLQEIKKQNMDDYIAAIKSTREIRRYVKIHVIGKEGVGKSSLVRRLVGDSNMKLNSTDGIDIVKKCKIRTTDGKWVIGKVETERDKIMKRIQEAVRKEPKQSEPVPIEVRKEAVISKESLSQDGGKQENESPTKDRLRIASPGTNTVEPSLTSENIVNIEDNVTIVEEKSEIDIPDEDDSFLSKDIKKADDLVKTDDIPKKITEQMYKILLEIQKDQDKMTSESLVECGIWDFAGQKDYYATHQTFLNPHAIYLLVTNIFDDIAAIEHETDFDSIEEYIDFWFDSIHCLSTNMPNGYSKHRLYPPVIVVCTHIDKYKTVKEVEKRKKEYIKRFKEIFGGQDKVNHNRGIHFISNTEFLESDCKKLKDNIYEVAKETMFFREELPTQWIQLENALSVLKDESKQNILSFQNIVELSKITCIGETQLLPFLTYQHKIGNIIFFEDIREYIILQPEWLVKCFRCLICDDHALKRNHAIIKSTDWHNLENTGQLSDDIIDKLFEKEPELEFGKYKTHILNVMEKFHILVKPKFIDTKDESSIIPNSYYMPCMIKQQPTSLHIIKNMLEGENGKFSFSTWLILEFQFLPLAYFNHILFYYITRYTVCEKAGQKTLYRGKTLVNLDKTGLRKLCVCFSKNAIAFQVWTLTDVEDNIYSTILVELCRKIKELKTKLRQSISYHIKAKCSNGDYSKKEGRMTFKDLGEICVNGLYYCSEHNEIHSKDGIEKNWLQHADIVEQIYADRAEVSTRQDDPNPKTEPNKENVQDQISVKTSLPISLTLRQQLNIKKTTNESLYITNCIKTGNTLVFTDISNDRLIICNADGTDIHHISLSYEPYDITEIDSTTVSVSCSDRTILIINISSRSVASTINTSGFCWGISYNDNKLYVVIGRSKIHVMDLTGKVTRTIPVPSDDIIDITVDRDRLVCIDKTSIYCCSLVGKLMWKFKKDEFQDLHGVTTGTEGNVYLTDRRTNTVIAVSDDGKHHRELLTKSDGLNKPWGIYFDKKENRLLVCNRNDAFLFDIKQH